MVEYRRRFPFSHRGSGDHAKQHGRKAAREESGEPPYFAQPLPSNLVFRLGPSEPASLGLAGPRDPAAHSGWANGWTAIGDSAYKHSVTKWGWRRYPTILLAAALALSGCSGGASHTVTGRTALSTLACVSDDPLRIQVFNEGGTLIAQGSVRPPSSDMCDIRTNPTVHFTIADVPEADFYTFRVEDVEGEETFSYAEMESMGWAVALHGAS
jgi:hypothetical protein